MPLSMRKKVFITAAITGSGGTQVKAIWYRAARNKLPMPQSRLPKQGQRSRIAMSETRKQARPRACRNSIER